MAVILGKTNHVQHGVLQTTWTGLGTMSATDTGSPDQLSRYPTHSVQFGGTFGGATAVLEGSDDGITYFTLTGEGPTGGADVLISATAAQRFDFPNVVPQHIRPRIATGGVTTNIFVIITSKTYGN